MYIDELRAVRFDMGPSVGRLKNWWSGFGDRDRDRDRDGMGWDGWMEW